MLIISRCIHFLTDWVQDLLEYKKKHRVLKVRMLDGSVKTLMVDDSHTVAQLMITICSKIGQLSRFFKTKIIHKKKSAVGDILTQFEMNEYQILFNDALCCESHIQRRLDFVEHHSIKLMVRKGSSL